MSQFVFAVGVCAADLGYELSARVYAYECVFCCVCLFLSEPYCLRAWFSHWEGTAVAVHYRERERPWAFGVQRGLFTARAPP